MAREYDNLLKYLAENHGAAFAAWLLGRPVPETLQLLKTELSLQPIRADFLAQYDLDEEILHLEFETDPTRSEPPLPLRMLDYFVRTYRRERKPVRQIVIVLKDTKAHIPDEFHVGETRHRYRVVKMCEQDPAALLAHEGLWPLAVLAHSDDPQALLAEVAEKVQNIAEPAKRSEMTAATYMLAGLRFDDPVLLRRLFREEIMIESSTYRYVLEQGELRGEVRGEERGIRQGKLEMLLEQISYRFGQIPEAVRQQVTALDLPHLINLGTALFDCKSLDDLLAWLKANQASIAMNGRG